MTIWGSIVSAVPSDVVVVVTEVIPLMPLGWVVVDSLLLWKYVMPPRSQKATRSPAITTPPIRGETMNAVVSGKSRSDDELVPGLPVDFTEAFAEPLIEMNPTEPPSVTFGATKPSIDNRGIAKWLLPPPLPSAVLDQSTFTIVPLASASAWVPAKSSDDVELHDDTPKRRSALRMTFPTKGTTGGRGALGIMGCGSSGPTVGPLAAGATAGGTCVVGGAFVVTGLAGGDAGADGGAAGSSAAGAAAEADPWAGAFDRAGAADDAAGGVCANAERAMPVRSGATPMDKSSGRKPVVREASMLDRPLSARHR